MTQNEGGKKSRLMGHKKIKYKSMEYHKKYKAEGKEQHEVVTLMMNGRC